MLEPFRYAFVQRGIVELLLLSVCAGLVGSFVVLRGLSFFTHAVGTATFPGLVLADGIGFSALLGAAGAALAFAGGVERTSRRRQASYDSLTALALVAALAGGVVLASDVFHSGSNVETLLFGSLLVIDTRDLVFAGAAAAAAVVVAALLGRRWLATGFDAGYARAIGLRSPLPDAILLVLVASSATVSVAAVGSLLVSALCVVPAATVRLLTRRVLVLQLGTIGLVALEGIVGIWLSVEWNAPPGATIAVLSGACFGLVALVRLLPRRPAVVPGLALLLLSASGCGGGDGGDASGLRRVDVVATTTQIGDWAHRVGAEHVDVHQLLHPNTDPHDYEPRPADVEATASAEVVLESGDGLDPWMAKVVQQAGGNPMVVVLADHLPVERPGIGPKGSRYDPHWWHDPRNAVAAVEEIRDALAGEDPAHADAYRRNARAYMAQLRALDRRIRACMAKVPAHQRKLVTDHDAFGYFAARYGITVVGAVFPSQSTQAQPSARDLARLIALVKRERVQAVFPESSINRRLAESIAGETGASAAYTLYGDTLGPAGSAGGSYLSMEAANARAMAAGFTGGRVRCELPRG